MTTSMNRHKRLIADILNHYDRVGFPKENEVYEFNRFLYTKHGFNSLPLDKKMLECRKLIIRDIKNKQPSKWYKNTSLLTTFNSVAKKYERLESERKERKRKSSEAEPAILLGIFDMVRQMPSQESSYEPPAKRPSTERAEPPTTPQIPHTPLVQSSASRKELEKMEKSLQQQGQTLKDKGALISQFRERLQIAEEAWNEKDKQIEQLNADMKQLKSRSRSKEDFELLEGQLKHKGEMLQMAEKMKEEMQESIVDLMSKIGAQGMAIASKNKRIEDLQNQRGVLGTEHTHLQGTVSRLEAELREKTAKILSLEKQVEEKDSLLSQETGWAQLSAVSTKQFEEVNRKLQETLAGKEKEVEELLAKQSEMESQLKKMTANLQGATQRIGNLQGENRMLNVKRAEQSRKNEHLKEKLQQLEYDLEARKEMDKQRVEELERQLTEKEERLREQSRKNEDLEEKMKQLEYDLEARKEMDKQRVEELERQLAEKEEKVMEQEGKIRESEVAMTELKEKVKRREHANESTHQDREYIADLNSKLHAQKLLIQTKSAKIEELESKAGRMAELQEQVHTLTTRLQMQESVLATAALNQELIGVMQVTIRNREQCIAILQEQIRNMRVVEPPLTPATPIFEMRTPTTPTSIKTETFNL